jgi:hypothetical protein
MSDSITIGTKKFPIGQTEEDRSRRHDYFTREKGTLTPSEEGLLAALGIDEEMMDSYRLWLPDFFINLPACQTDTALILSKSCEIPHYILWSVMFRSNQATQARIAKDRSEHEPLGDLDTAKTEELVKVFQTSGPPVEASRPSRKANTTSSKRSRASQQTPVSPTSPSPRPALAKAPVSPAAPSSKEASEIRRIFTIPYI